MDFKKLTSDQMKVAEMVISAAEANGIDPNLLLAQAYRESGFKHTPNNETDAFGVMQIRPGTAKENNLGDITDLKTNIYGGAKLMKQYLDKYKSPEAALLAYHQGPGVADTYIKSGGDLKSVGPKGLDYVINIGENGGFGQPQEPNQEESSKVSPFAGLKEEFAETNRQIQESQNAYEETKIPTTLLEKASALFNQVDPAYGAGAGAVANVAGAQFVKPPLTSTEQANLSAQDKLELTRQKLQQAAPQGVEDLQKSYAESQGELERIKNEQKLREMQLNSIPPASPPPAPIPQEQFEVESRKLANAGSPYNTVQAVANQRVPYNLAIQAIDTTHNQGHGKGSYDIVDIFNQGVARAAPLGGSEYVLTGEKGPGELYLPRKLADPMNAEIQQRTETTQNQQAIFEQGQEQERQRLQAELDQLQKQRASHGSQHNVLAGQIRDVKPLQRATTTAEINAEVAKRKAERAAQNPNMTPQDLLNKGKMVGRTVAGGAAGYYGMMSAQEALNRYNAGDTSEAVMQALGSLSAGASLVPPVNPKLSAIKKAGALGALGMGAREVIKRLTQEPPAQ
jgi:hypothetical protein